MNPIKYFIYYDEPLTQWELNDMPKLPKRQTYTPVINRKSKRY